jgi:hypothetical protein
MSEQLEALARICRRLGGQLVVLSRGDFFTVLGTVRSVIVPLSAGSRFEYGIQWRKKMVYAVRVSALSRSETHLTTRKPPSTYT